MTPKETYYETLAKQLIKKMEARNFGACYCPTKVEALEMAYSFLTPNCSVSYGGSESLKEIGLISALASSDFTVYDRASAKTEEEKRELFGKIVTSDVFFTSANAITAAGELVNIDGSGNRVACLIHGPKQVVVVASLNKVCPDVDTAIKRIRQIACPQNAVRLNLSTPCGSLATCAECLNEETMCCHIVTTRASRIKGRIQIILVGEEIGY